MRSSLAVLSGIMAIAGGTGLASVWIVRSWRTVLLTCLALLIALAIFTTARLPHLFMIIVPDRPSHDYYLFVLGSGGHTKEMLMMMDDGFCAFANFHRRYLISSGDRMSRHHLQDYEEQLEQLCRAAESSPGTHDTRTVTRARRVHQSLWTTPFTSLVSIVDIFSVLLSPPANEAGRRLRYPRLILSNGPATGFFVALVAHVLKVFFIVPEDCMRFVYIESWARISTLSLTGKLLLYTGIADALYVQHQQVAAMYGLVNAGEMVFNSRRPDA
ncbi:oligosaccharide biosynthesis protein alg14 like domain-containing protein [Hirsutella rhossiliensis]